MAGLGYDLVDVERAARGLLRITIDRLPGQAYAVESEFVTVDDCEVVTRQLQHVLEVEGCDYARLEVSSPGLDRPLKRPADYARFAGLAVDVTLREPFQGRRKFRGRLVARPDAPGDDAAAQSADAPPSSDWRLELDGDQALDFSLPEVREARLVPVVDFKGRRGRPAAEVPQDVGGSKE